MQIFLSSFSGKTSALTISSSDTVRALKEQVKGLFKTRTSNTGYKLTHLISWLGIEGLQTSQQRLTFNACRLDDASTLADYNLTNGCTFYLDLELLGGGKKRKKKVYTTPKKIKHKNKKTKLAVLKYYKVDGDGKIERLRRECPQAEVRYSTTNRSNAKSTKLTLSSAVLVSLWLRCIIGNTAVTVT